MIEYFPKLIELDDLSPEGEPTIQIVRPGEYNRLGHVKTAGEALDYIKQVKPIPGKTVILVLAMTAGEFYGPNRNGDAWPERPLQVGQTKITEDQVLPKHFKTFETSANVFKHHVNKDPNKKIGDVLKAFYNWPMHRVELLLALDNFLAEDIVDRIEKDEFPAVSMGCKVKYDVCSLCGNKAPSRKQYCPHAKFQLGEFTRNGKKIFVWNPSPRFFDISMVRRPADKHGYMMKKVAAAIPEIRSSALLGEYVDTMSRKVANLRKLSLIDKVLKGEVAAAKEDDGVVKTVKDFGDRIAKPAAEAMPPIDDHVLRGLLRYRPAEVLSTLSSMGIFLTTPEFIKYFAWKMDPSIDIPQDVLDRAVASQGAVFDFLADNPSVLDDIDDTGFMDICPENVNPDLAKKASFLLEKRSQVGEYLHKKLVPNIFRDRDLSKGNWDVINVTDPHTGRQFQTTRWAAGAASDEAARRQMKNVVGGGALLAGAMALTPFRGLRLAFPFLAVPGAAMAYKGYRGYPHVRAHTGEKVYTPTTEFLGDRYIPTEPSTWDGYRGTELIEKRSDAQPDETNMIIKMALDYAHRPGYRSASVDIEKIRRMEAPSFDAAIHKIGEVICP
jgi:hypothetical protein